MQDIIRYMRCHNISSINNDGSYVSDEMNKATLNNICKIISCAKYVELVKSGRRTGKTTTLAYKAAKESNIGKVVILAKYKPTIDYIKILWGDLDSGINKNNIYTSCVSDMDSLNNTFAGIRFSHLLIDDLNYFTEEDIKHICEFIVSNPDIKCYITCHS